MEPAAFKSTDRGQVVRAVEGYWAFHPTELPHELALPQGVATLLDEATGAVHRLGGVGRLIPNPHLLIGPHLRLEERGDLREVTGKNRNRIYEAAQIFDAAYGDIELPDDSDSGQLTLGLDQAE